jgi:ABC-2 type transport system permease protein
MKMVNVIFEIARKEVMTYYGRKNIIVQNVMLIVVFSLIPIQQVGSQLAVNGYRAGALSAMLDVLLMIAAFYPIMVASGISVLAFPYEKDQKTIEHLMSLPLADGEVFIGKALASIVTGLAGLALVYSIVLGYVFIVEGGSIAWDAPLLTPSLAVFIFGVAPLMVVLSTMLLIALSSYISNTRESYLINVVIMGVMIGLNSARLAVRVDPLLFNVGLLVMLAALAIITYTIGMKAFNREKLISRV